MVRVLSGGLGVPYGWLVAAATATNGASEVKTMAT